MCRVALEFILVTWLMVVFAIVIAIVVLSSLIYEGCMCVEKCFETNSDTQKKS